MSPIERRVYESYERGESCVPITPPSEYVRQPQSELERLTLVLYTTSSPSRMQFFVRGQSSFPILRESRIALLPY